MFMCRPKGGGKTHATNSAVAVAIEGAMITYNINFDSKYKEKCTMISQKRNLQFLFKK